MNKRALLISCLCPLGLTAKLNFLEYIENSLFSQQELRLLSSL